MAFRPHNYEEAITFLRARRPKDRLYRVVSRDGRDIRDQIVALTDAPYEIEQGTCPVAFRQWDTDIVTFYPDGSAEVVGYDSNTTRDRMREMALPFLDNMSRGSRYGVEIKLLEEPERMVGCTPRFNNQYPLGVPGCRVVLSRTPGGWEPHPTRNNFTDSLRVPKPGLRQRFTASKKALLKELRTYWAMAEQLNVGNSDFRKLWLWQAPHVRNHLDAIDAGLLAGYKRKDWNQWLVDELADDLDPQDVHPLIELVHSNTFWEATGPEHYDRVSVHASEVADKLQELRHEL